MLKYSIKKVFSLIPILVFTTFIVFMVIHLSPGDPAIFGSCHSTPEIIHQWREIHGLNDPVLVQFANYITGIFRGDFGLSFTRNVSITDEIMQRLPYTLRLGAVALGASLAVALPIGALAASKKNAWLDAVVKYAALIGVSIPVFGMGLLLILIFAIRLDLLPSSRAYYWYSVALPSATLGIGMMCVMIYSIRTSILEALQQNYTRAARAMGLSRSNVIRKHIMHNALVPILTTFRAHLGNFFVGMIIVEITFAWPGIGRLFIQSILSRDYPMTTGVVFMFVLFYALVNVSVGIVMGAVDPRVRETLANEKAQPLQTLPNHH